jgi:hypothetical protein
LKWKGLKSWNRLLPRASPGNKISDHH